MASTVWICYYSTEGPQLHDGLLLFNFIKVWKWYAFSRKYKMWSFPRLVIFFVYRGKQLSHECMFLSSLPRHNKDLEWQTLKPPQHVTALGSWTDHVIALRSRMDHVIALRQISVTAQFYLEDSRKIHLRGGRARRSTDTRRRAPQRVGERERES